MLNAIEQIEKFKEFIDEYYKDKINSIIKIGHKSLLIDFSELKEFDYELAEQLLNEPEESLKALELSLDNFDIKSRIRICNLPESQLLLIRNIRSENLGKFVIVDGIVRLASDVRPQVVSAKFECPGCGNNITILQIDTKFKEPFRCSCGRKGRFRMISKELVDAQRLIIEEAPESLEGGEQPKRISVFLKEDLVEPKMEKKTTPGSKVRIMGIIREVAKQLKTGVQSTSYDLMIDCNFIEPIEETYEEIDISKEEEEKIIELSKNPMLNEKFIGSVAPSIYGHELIKEALILQLFSGVKKKKEDGTVSRGDMHVLLVGDPGAAKSTLLMSISKIAPKGRFVSGKGASAAGLTASVVKDEFLRGWALEAGAMVLANKGIAIVDELDKMGHEDRDALHEAMEQQRVSISKANIQATLRCETTILAAANPKMGRFDMYTPIANQIDLPSTLINRFDLIFPVRDIPNKEKDERIASHVLKMHKDPQDIKTDIPIPLLRKYIAYAKQHIHPKLTDSAIDEIKEFYVGLRGQGGSEDSGPKPVPISARQLEALVRLSEASAKSRLSNTVTKQDAKRAINLLRYCLMQVGYDHETGKIDIDRISSGITASKRGKAIVVKDLIGELEGRGNKTISLDELMAMAAEKGIRKEQFEEIVELLKKNGEIFEPRRGFIARVN